MGRILWIITPERSSVFLSVYNEILSTPTLNLGKRQMISVYLTTVFQSQEEMRDEEQHKSAIRNAGMLSQ